MILVDLHTHSTCSDGTVSPQRLVELACRSSVAVLSLTDHDSVEGVPSFLAACQRHGVQGLAGVELSAEFPSTMHILGYGFDPGHAGFLHKLNDIRTMRNQRNYKIIDRLRSIGVDLSMEEVEAYSGGTVVARPHLARAMVERGYCATMRECFDRYLKRGAPGYVPRVRLSPQECIELIRSAGGLAVLAHPIQTARDIGDLRPIVKNLKDMGLWGLECVSAHHSPEWVFRYMELAGELGLFPTAGSDFHGANRPGVSLGVLVDDDFLPWARLGVSL